jgi:hypothetical protein
MEDGNISRDRKYLVMDHIADAYAESRRNTALGDIDRQAYFGGATLKVQFLANFRPIPTIGGLFKQHRLDGARESAQSRTETYLATRSGQGNFTPEKFGNKNQIDQSILDDMNARLGIE